MIHTSPADLTGSTRERADLLDALRKHRYFLRFTVQGLSDEQARSRPTASELTLGGLIKHVTGTERRWIDFMLEGPSAMTSQQAAGGVDEWSEAFRMTETETLSALLEKYDEVARRTDDLVASIPDLDSAHPLPDAPWFEPGATWSARRVLLHLIAETSQHAGHADIIRESIDGQKSMG